jgi:hypothetical protein
MKTAASTSAGPIDLFMMASIFRIGGATFIDASHAPAPSQLGVKLLSFAGVDFHHREGF